MSLPNFPGSGGGGSSSGNVPNLPHHKPIFELPLGGSGDHLPVWLLACCGSFTAVATAVSIMSITLQLKSYRRPALQRAVVRIMVMVPLYALSSLIALFSLEAAFFIDAVRDLYEAFVIYTFLQLLITYLGGERSLLITLHGRPPIPHPFPMNIFLSPMDVSDPWVLLNLKRGVLQYVQIKPLLVVATIVLKATGTYQEGRFAWDSGYTYISVVYNTSICLSLYCLAMFWVAVNTDLKPFRPVPYDAAKFLCVKGILFFSFWQSIAVSFLVAVHAIKQVGPYTDAEHMSLALVDSLICFEMPIFAIAHASDYIDDNLINCARLPFVYAFRDAFGMKDVWEDTKDTIRGSGISYQTYEPSEGGLHYGAGRQKRIRAGLRYSRGGQSKYWLPIPGDSARNTGETGPLTAIKRRVDERLSEREGFAPLLPKQANRVVRPDPAAAKENNGHWGGLFDSDSEESDAPSLDFDSVGEDEDQMYDRARRIGYAGFPNVDVSREASRRRRKHEEDGILAGKWTRAAGGSGSRPAGRERGSNAGPRDGNAKGKGKGKAKEPSPRVYGGWADRQSSVEPDLLGPDPDEAFDGPSQSHNGPVGLYDGDVERPDAWQPNGVDGAAQMRWAPKPTKAAANKGKASEQHRGKESLVREHAATAPTAPNPSKPSQKKTSSLKPPSSQPKARSRRSSKSKSLRSKSPFSLGHDSDSDPSPAASPSLSISPSPDPKSPVSPSSRPLPSDAVDLVVEDTEAREEARQHERRKGEPQTSAPAHIYVAQRSGSDIKVDKVQEVYEHEDDVHGERRVSEDMGKHGNQGAPVAAKDSVRAIESIGRTVENGHSGEKQETWRRAARAYGDDQEDNPWA